MRYIPGHEFAQRQRWAEIMLVYHQINLLPYPNDQAPTRFRESEFQAFCRTQNVTLPEDYLSFLRETNGGRVDPKQNATFRCISPRQSERLRLFYPSHPDMNLIGLESIRRLDSEFFPPYLFAIGECYPDRILAIVLSGPMCLSCVVVNLRVVVPDTTVSPESFFRSRGVSIAAKSFTSLIQKIILKETA